MIARIAIVLTAGWLSLSLSAAEPCNDTHCIERSSISAGGTVKAESGDGQWRVAGSIGQWEASEAREVANSTYTVTGGFWGLTLEEIVDRLFSDRFESG